MLITEDTTLCRQGTTNRILHALRLEIVTGQLPKGAKIVESELSERFGVSRGTVRAVLDTLRQEGLIRVLDNGRKEAVGLSARQIRDLYDLRWMIENRALQIIINEHLLALSPMAKALEDMKASFANPGSDEEWCDLDIQFHRGLVLASNNQALYRAWEVNMPVMRVLMPMHRVQKEDDYVQTLYNEHLKIFSLVVSGDQAVYELHYQHMMRAFPQANT